MTTAEDAQLARELEALMAAKTRAQRLSWAWFALALGMFLLAFRWHRPGFLLAEAALLVLGCWQGGRAHLRADALRGQAMEKILAESLRRGAQDVAP
jgi:putative methionine-R-sulfoxide reductase with GAF domain